jgi:polysaccharide biosynthesis transport protein
LNTLPVPNVLVEPVKQAAPSDVAALFKFLRRYRLGILIVTVAAALLGVLVALSMPPVYYSTVTLLIEPRGQRVVQQVAEVYDPTQGQFNDYFATQLELLRSRSLAERVVDKLKLDESDEFLNDAANVTMLDGVRAKLDWQRFLPFLPPPDPARVLTPEQRRDKAVSVVLAQIGVQPIPRTRLMRVQYFSGNPETAQKVANTIADAYIESGLESRLDATQHAGRWLTEKLTDLSNALQKAERNLQAFRDQNQIVSTGSNRGLLDAELMENAQRMRDAQRVKTELSSTYSRIKASDNDPAKLEQITALLQDGGVQKARAALLDAEQSLKATQQRYGEKHPLMASSISNLQAARRAFDDQLRNAAEGVRNQYEIAQETERQMSGVVADTTGRARALDRKQFELGVLEREVDSNRQLYELFLQRFKETSSTTDYEPINARVTDSAQLPKSAALPERPKIIAIATFIGLLLGLTLASLKHVLSDGVSTVEDLEQITQVPLFGIVPKVSFGRGKQVLRYFKSDPRTPFAEGVRSVRTAVRLAELDQRKQCYVITSAVPGEGKSSLASCLAVAASGTERVLLLEGDLRAPVLHKMFGIGKEHRGGLMEVLLGQSTLEAAIHKESDNLDVLAVAQRPPNPSETVSSMAFAALLQQLRSRYDRIIIDSPPCLAASDTLVLARLSDAVLYLACADATPARTVKRAIHHLRGINAPLAGCVFNKVDVRRHLEAHGDYRYAYRYYG